MRIMNSIIKAVLKGSNNSSTQQKDSDNSIIEPILVKENADRPESNVVSYHFEFKNSEIGYIDGNIIERLSGKKFFNLQWFKVKENYRNNKERRYGRRLMQALVSDLKERNAKSNENPIEYIRVYPKPDDKDITVEELYKIYEKLGFYFVSKTPNLQTCNEEMRLDLLDL